jgi:Concanavalin A-like lectin/glucanases superfamily
MTDPYIDNVVLALPFDQDAPGSRGSLDYSNYKQMLTWSGSSALSTAQSKFGGASAYFDGSGDCITSSDVFNFGSGDFTLEAWVYPTTLAAGTYYCCIGNGYPIQLYIHNNNMVFWASSSNTSGTYLVTALTGPASSVGLNVWSHIAVTRSGNTYQLWVNGTGGGTATVSGAVAIGNSLPTLGGLNLSGSMVYYYSGYMDDLRVTKGVARYTTNFTPPTAFKGDYPSPPNFHGVNIPALYGKSAFQWCLLDKKGVNIPASYQHRQPNTTQWWSGTGTITGLVEIGSTPVKRKVRLYESSTGVLLWEKWAANDGTYTFDTVSKAMEFTITAPDHTGIYNDVIAARVRAV